MMSRGNNLELTTITSEIWEASKRLEKGSKELFSFARIKAEKEYIYRQALAREIFRLKEEKIPVTLIPDLARGNMADLKRDRDIADLAYQAGRDSLDAIKQQVSCLQSILKYQSEVS